MLNIVQAVKQPFSAALSRLFDSCRDLIGMGVRWKDVDPILRASMPRELVEHRDACCMEVKESDPKRRQRCRQHCSFSGEPRAARREPKWQNTCHAGFHKWHMPIYGTHQLMGILIFGPFQLHNKNRLPFSSPHMSTVFELCQQMIPRLMDERNLERAHYSRGDVHPALRVLSQCLLKFTYDQSVEDLASVCQISVSRLQHLCKEQYGESLGAICERALLRRVQVALQQHTQPIGHLALDFGFYDQRYFSTWFRRLADCTPSEWRRRETDPI